MVDDGGRIASGGVGHFTACRAALVGSLWSDASEWRDWCLWWTFERGQ